MEKLVEFWVGLVLTFEAKLSDIPAKIKGAVVSKLYEVGFIGDEDLSEVKDAKIAEMNTICNTTILNGFDIALSDGHSYHFSLDYTDQTMISKLNDRAKAGDTFLPWHWDNGTCKIFSPEDIQAINTEMENLITYQITYFNSLRDYINSLSKIDKVMEIQYGVEIPEQYQSEVLKMLFERMKAE